MHKPRKDMNARTVRRALAVLPLLFVAVQPALAFDGELTRPMDRVREATVAQPAPPPRPDKLFVPFSAPQNFIDHARFFKEEVEKVGPFRIWLINTPGGGIGNIGVLEGDDGVVLVDTSTGTEFAKRALELIKPLTSKPVVAIIYTHHHVDHTAGANVFVRPEDAASGKVKIIAAENFMREAALENAAVGPIMGVRASYMYGFLLPPDAEGTHFHIGCCGHQIVGTNGFVPPNTFVPLQGVTEMKLAGYRMQFFHTGGEAASHIGIYLPDQRIVFVGDEVQGPTFPQLHSLRGTRPRDIERWFGAIDRVRSFDADYLVPGHGPVMGGAAEIRKMLTDYRDAMQYVLDQSIRLINQGKTPDELAETVKLPKALQTEPFGIEYYGNVDVSARNVYGGFISWWNGDPAELRPTPRVERARREVAMMGGRDKVFAEAERAFFAGDPQWAAELTTPLIRINKDDWPARHLKAAALRKIGYTLTSSSLRGFYLSGALEIEGQFDPLALQRAVAQQVLDPTTLPSLGLFTLLRYRVNPERAAGKAVSVGYSFSDTNEDFTLVLRNGILEVIPRRSERVEARVEMTRKQFDAIFAGSLTHEQAAAQGGRITGDGREIGSLFAVFDRPDEQPVPNTALR
jgi:alkyl sulfatase BDS1-like metallo-beta-lactamase superfamily hydrolase